MADADRSEVEAPDQEGQIENEPDGSPPQPNGASSMKGGAEETRVIAKFLMSNSASGSIIGKQGATITKFQEQSHARLQLSRSTELFPGTRDRVLLISGKISQVLTALHLVLVKVSGEMLAESRDGKSTHLRLLVPAALCGTIIGKAGATIRAMAEDSCASITVSSLDKQPVGVPDRVVRIVGDLEQLMRAVALLVTKLAENPNYSRHVDASVSYNTMVQGLQGLQLGGYNSGTPGGDRQQQQQQRTEVVMPIPESRVGALIGKRGEVVNQLKSVVGVKIRISDREDFFPGSRNRKVTVTGPAESVQIAQALINQKINQPGPE